MHREKPIKRWGTAWFFAGVFHLLLLAVIAWRLLPDHDVHISGMVPAPDETVELMPAQAIEPAVFFSSKPTSLNPQAAFLYKINEDGSRVLISSSHFHPKRNYGLQFEPVHEPGEYEIVVGAGADGVVLEPEYLDGEFRGWFPSGDGKPGGVFSARFHIESKAHDVMTATLYDPDKPMENEEPSSKRVVEKAVQPQKPVPPVVQKKVEKPVKPKRVKPTEAPKTAAALENMGPVESSPEPETNEPSPIPLTPESLRLSPFNFAPELLTEAAQVATQNFQERDTNKIVAGADLERKRFVAAYNGEGPVIGPGQQGNSLSHNKDVAEYLALMHKEIHPLWAHGYLLRLDTIYRQPGSRLNKMDLEAVLEITLDSLGAVIDVRMVRTSGITDYDNEAIHVAWNSSPKLAPPAEMRSNNGKSYIHWTFWRDQRQCGVFGVKVFKLKGTTRDALNFSLKSVQLHEKKLGLKPSVLQLPGDTKKGNTGQIEHQRKQESTHEPLPEKINPLEDL